MTQISIRLPDADTTAVDQLIDTGAYANRTQLVTTAVRQLLAAERERQIGEMYRRAYTEHPFNENGDEAWIYEARDRHLRENA